MSALGIAATGAGQGYMQGNQIQNERNVQQRQLGMEDKKYELSKAELDARNKRSDREFAAARLDKYDAIRFDPNANTKYSKKQIEMAEAGAAAVKRQFPELDENHMQPEVPGEVVPGQTAQPNAQQPAPAPQMDNTQLYDLQRQAGNEQAAATAPPDWMNLLSPSGVPQMGTPQFDPMGIPGGGPSRPIANPGVGNIGTGARPAPAAAMPAPSAPAQQQPAPAPGQPTQQPPADPVSLIRQQLANPDLTPDQVVKLSGALQDALSAQSAIEANTAGAALNRANAAEVHPNALSNRGVNTETVKSSQYERGEYKPGLLGIEKQKLEIEKIKAKQKQGGATITDLINLEKFKYEMAHNAATEQTAADERRYQHGKDAAEFTYKTGEGDRGEASDIRRAVIGMYGKSVMTVDPITHVPMVRPGGAQAFQRMIAQFAAKGITPTTQDLIPPGTPPNVWDAVNTPGFDVARAVQAAQSNGDARGAAVIQSTYDLVHKLTSASTVPQTAPRSSSSASPVVKPSGLGGGKGKAILDNPKTSDEQKARAFRDAGERVPQYLLDRLNKKGKGTGFIRPGDANWNGPRMGPARK